MPNTSAVPDPIVQANTPGAYGVRTRDQWVATVAQSLFLNYTNGNGAYFSGGVFAANGAVAGQVGLVNPADFGIAVTGGPNSQADPATYQKFVQIAQYMAQNWDTIDAASKQYLPPPVGPDGKPLPDVPYVDPETDLKYRADARAQANAEAARSQAAQELALKGQQIANQAAADQMDFSARMAAVAADREATASRERIATADRTESARQFDLGYQENVRQFDLKLGEDRRQFNATMLTNLLQIGVDLAKAPVDWLAHQYYMENMGIPLSFLNLTTFAGLVGALPPSGPSAAGPVVGGPAALDGDGTLAAQAGVQPALVSATEAVTANPGATSFAPMQAFTAATTFPQLASQVGGTQVVEQQLAQARTEELPREVGSNPVVDNGLVQASEALGAAGAGGAPIEQQPGAQPANQFPAGTPANRLTQPTPGMDSGGSATATGEIGPAPTPVGPPRPWTDLVASGEMKNPYSGGFSGMYGNPFGGGKALGVTDGIAPAPAAAFSAPAQALPEVPTTPAAPTSYNGYTPIQPGSTGSSGGGTTSGIYTGTPATPPASTLPAIPTSNGNPQGDVLLQQLSLELGIPIETLRNVVPTNLMAGGYSKEQIAQSPIIQALVNHNDRLSYFRTAPTDQGGGDRFATIGAFGIPLNIRSGQDINAGLLLKSNPSQQQEIQGALEATGQYFPDVQKQSLKASPVTNYQVGAFGRRRFA